MAGPIFDLGVVLAPEHRIELIVADLSLAHAFFEGVPAARLLARGLLARGDGTEADGDAQLTRFSPDAEALERLRRAIARHERHALDEGPLPADRATIAALVFGFFSSASADASLAEIFASDPPRPPEAVARACAFYDGRLASPNAPGESRDVRVPLFEACVRLATNGACGPWSYERMVDMTRQLASSEIGIHWASAEVRLFPLDIAVAQDDARMTRIDRASLDAFVTRDPRELAAAIARAERSRPPSRARLDTFVADLAVLLRSRGALVLALPLPDPEVDEPLPSAPPSDRPSSIPLDWSHDDVAASLADAVERGVTPLSRVRNLVARGGEPALDAIGAEMLKAPLHPFASAVFADILARSGRPRDVIRLVTHFAIAPEPQVAARSLSSCSAPELPSVLRAWLEAMLPSDGGDAPFGDDPQTSSAARLTACVASLQPYPHLYQAVKPLLSRVSEHPPASS